MANYPNSLPAIPDAGSLLSSNPHDVLHDGLRDEVLAIATELGTAPSGSYATVKSRLDSLEGAWATVTLTNDWETATGCEPLRYRKIGDQVTLYGSIMGGTDAVGTLPSGFRPAATKTQFVGTVNDVSGDIQALLLATVDSSGVIDFTAWSPVSAAFIAPLDPPTFMSIDMVFEAA